MKLTLFKYDEYYHYEFIKFSKKQNEYLKSIGGKMTVYYMDETKDGINYVFFLFFQIQRHCETRCCLSG